MQFADCAFRFLAVPLRESPGPRFIAVCLGVAHQDRRQRPLALLSLRNEPVATVAAKQVPVRHR